MASSLISLVGNTPIVELTRFDTGPCRLFVKLECLNPGGSIKDRIALYMVKAAEESGQLKPKGTLVEATAGNTGIGLAQIAALKGYQLVLVIPDKMSQEKINQLQAMDAEIIITPSEVCAGDPWHYEEVAKRVTAETKHSYYVNQFANPMNVQAHYETTAPEIWQQMNNQVDAVVCGIGTGGHLTGIGRYFKKVAPRVKIVLADTAGSVFANKVDGRDVIKDCVWLVEGVGGDHVPDICDINLVSCAYTVTDREAFTTARTLLKKEGIFGGSSSGTAVAAAIKYCQEQKESKNVVTFVYDSGNKYLSKMYNDDWMREKNLL